MLEKVSVGGDKQKSKKRIYCKNLNIFT